MDSELLPKSTCKGVPINKKRYLRKKLYGYIHTYLHNYNQKKIMHKRQVKKISFGPTYVHALNVYTPNINQTCINPYTCIQFRRKCKSR